uniref:Uncharacterized protein n=1 Tax=Setaria italica TaxID=4555 RepID=K3Z0B3_SETIT
MRWRRCRWRGAARTRAPARCGCSSWTALPCGWRRPWAPATPSSRSPAAPWQPAERNPSAII